MSRSVTCYPIPGKRKALLLCEAFAAGVRACGGAAHVCTNPPRELGPGAAVFYGVRPAVAHLWQQATREGRDWYYIDNSYFDVVREKQFRVTKGALQHTGRGESDGSRFGELGINIKPMRAPGAGDYALICTQSDEFMRCVAADAGWLDRMMNYFAACGRDAVVRFKHTGRSLRTDLERAELLVTWSSAAAVEALLAGVRVMCAPQCCATHADDRRRWAAVLADNQWTLDEITRGDAWRKLN